MAKKNKKIFLGVAPEQTEEILFMVRLSYIASGWMGVASTSVVLAVFLMSLPLTFSVVVNGLITFALLAGGIAGFVFNIKKNILSEYVVIIPVIIGLASVTLLYIMDNVDQILTNHDLTPMAGLSGAFVTFFIYYLIKRYIFIYRWIEDGKKNRAVIEKIEGSSEA